MPRRAPVLLATALAACTAMSHDPAGMAASLAAAETAFAAQSVREGLRAAFLAWLSPDAILFRNGPVNGPALISARPDPPIVLDWRPAFVEVASSGEFGVSTGPWTITSRADAKAPPRHGQFFSVWTRPPGGDWRVKVDLGISHPGPALADAALVAGVTPAIPDATGEAVDAAEARFAHLAAQEGDRAAYAAFASATIRLYREGHAPFLGRDAALASPAAGEGRTAWALASQGASRAGDLAYAIGSYGPPGAAAAGHYVRVWRREPAGWRVAADVTNALAAP